MNDKLKRIFAGKVINKALTREVGLGEFPRYVVEYLIDNYCSEESFAEDLKLVSSRLRESYAHSAEAQAIKSLVRERGQHPLLARLEVHLSEAEDRYWGAVEALGERHIHISPELVRQYPMLLSGGMWGTLVLGYDDTIIHRGQLRPYVLLEFTPFQVARLSLDEYLEKRAQFSSEEWLDILINTFGLNPEVFSRREKLLILSRAIPLVERNSNLIELGPRETGKTYLLRNLSYYAHVISGGRSSASSIFFNQATGRVGMVGSRDLVAFDEIRATDFADTRSFVSLMQNYMQDASLSRGRRELVASSSIMLSGNIDVQGELPHEKYYHLLEELPSYLQGVAFLDRIHAYIPGWEIPKLTPRSFSQDWGFVADYFCEIMHLLRHRDPLSDCPHRVQLVDLAGTSRGPSERDERAFHKNLSGLAKLLYPHGQMEERELEELGLLACELRQRVRNQLHLIAPGEYETAQLGVQMASGRIVAPYLKDGERKQRVTLPEGPAIGQVVGLGIYEGHGVLLRFEMVVSRGTGRVITLGSIRRVMRESVEAAVSYIRTNAARLGIDPRFAQEMDISILATQMGIPKEGPSAGLPILVGLVSVLKGLPVRSDVALTGEITLMGHMLGVGNVQEKLHIAQEAGVREVILPQENDRDIQFLPPHLKKGLEITLASQVEEALARVLIA